MGYTVDLKSSSRQQPALKAVKERATSPRTIRSLKFQDKHQIENTSSQPYVVQLKPSNSNQKQSSGSEKKKDDELVKHMSNLPGYLQRIEKGENIQEKALNFGVLDWNRLERWKYNEKFVPTRSDMKGSSSGSNSSYTGGRTSIITGTAQGKSFTSQRKQPSSHGWRLNLSSEDRKVLQSEGKVTKPQGFETAPWSTMEGRRYRHMNDNFLSGKTSEIQIDRGKNKDLGYMNQSEKGTSSPNRRKNRLPISSHDTNAQDRETNTAVEEEIDFDHHSCDHENIVLLLPRSSSKKSFPESNQLSRSRKSFDGNLAEAIGKRISGCFSPEELDSVQLFSEIPHSCPLPVKVASNMESDMQKCDLVNSQGMDIQFDGTQILQRPKVIPNLPSRGKHVKVNSSSMDPCPSTETPRTSNQGAEQPATKGRHPSPSRRFSFSSIGRMTRSFSFKEGPAAPQLSSSYATVKSGPVGSIDFDKVSLDNASAGTRARSSPLRRLLDPLLKSRGAQSAESVKPSNVNLNPVSIKPMNTSELIDTQKSETSTVQALLQLTLKNGLPLFKLVVDNSNEILAAAVKKLPIQEENVSSLIYTLYSVHEMKKKSGNWMSQGSRGKNSSLGYNIIGQMKVFSSSVPDLIGQNADHSTVRESILYGVDIGQGEKETPKFVPSRELAAIVVKNSSQTNKRERSENNYLFSEEDFTRYLLDSSSDSDGRENEDSNSTTVILPGGIHGLPTEGVPSPLINRWRSGGSCDCGGWDIGCKLQILNNQGQSSKNLRSSVSHSSSECLDLFVEGAQKEKKPIFSLVPFKSEVYSVDFDPSISLLQAFFISVAFLSSQKLSGLFEGKLEGKSLLEPTSETIKCPTASQGEAPAKYVTNPPPSPVGRV